MACVQNMAKLVNALNNLIKFSYSKHKKTDKQSAAALKGLIALKIKKQHFLSRRIILKRPVQKKITLNQ